MRVLSMDELEKMFFSNGQISLDDVGIPDAIVRDIMMNEVAEVVEAILLKHIQSDIYDAYYPHIYSWSYIPQGWKRVGDTQIQYSRRMSLISTSGIYKEMDGNELFLTVDASPNTPVFGSWNSSDHGSFLRLLEEGPGPVWKGGFPRPAVSNAQAEIDSSREVQDAFNRGLRRHGIG